MRYIKINSKYEICDVIHDRQKNKFDGTEIEFDDNEGHKIDGKSISNKHGIHIFKWDGAKHTEKPAIDIETDNDNLLRHYEKKLKDLTVLVKDWPHLSNANENQVRTLFATFSRILYSSTSDIDSAYNKAVEDMHLI